MPDGTVNRERWTRYAFNLFQHIQCTIEMSHDVISSEGGLTSCADRWTTFDVGILRIAQVMCTYLSTSAVHVC
jgi:hypothetical protein